MNDTSFAKILDSLPVGSFYGTYNQSKYLVTKELFSNNKIIKIYARELKGNDIVSGNYFKSIKNGVLKPCEMSDTKVINFVSHLKI